MRMAKVLFKSEVAGILIQHDDATFTFKYNDNWLIDVSKPSISLTLPKHKALFQSNHLFPFFYNMLPEGTNKHLVCHEHKIEQDDYFGILLNTAQYDNIGAVSIQKIETNEPT
jgi:HipA-like protein